MTHATATFALGCFWGPDARFGALPGVIRTRVGYTGGTTPHPTYKSIGDHTEALQIDYDPDTISYVDLLEVFWHAHTPTAQPYSTQYRNAIWVHDDDQRHHAEATKARVQSGLAGTVHTAIEPLGVFTRAEDYHQKWGLRRHEAVMAHFEDAGDAFTDSTLAARLNGFLSGHGSPEQVRATLSGLPDEIRAAVDA